MSTWKYLKGTAEDFEGAPDWATMKCYCSLDKKPNNDFAWCEGIFKGASWKALLNDSQLKKMDYPEQWFAVAQRERVTSINDDRLAQDVAAVNPKYNRPCKGVTIDVYDVLQAFNVTNPALQHLVKKALAVGQRGHKDKMEDLRDILASAQRAIELEEVGE